ncbi:MAG: metallopeptidase TldD-related protein [Myxococcales bacterium]|nr:TldD/PmbA family protein [Myxococcota bacterium]MDW8282971.1 metallopeptidase TldD-related protein [Myxococcales bacterium]
MYDQREELCRIAQEVAARAVAAGADEVEVVAQAGAELSVEVRLGQPELIHEAGARGLGLRLFEGRRTAVTYTSDFREEALRDFIATSVALCRLSEPDELNQLPARHELAREPLPELELWDERAFTVDAAGALERAQAAEAAALSWSPKITNSDGASYSRVYRSSAFVSADRSGICFCGTSRGTYQSLVVKPLCDDADGKKRNGSYWTADRFLDRLLSPEEVGRRAAERTVRKLGAEKIATAEMPVVFDPDAGRALLGLLFSVVSGGAIYRQASYLCGREGSQVASPLVSVVDDPLILRGPGSRAFDGDGLPSRRNVVVEAGVLRCYLLDTYSARKLGRASNGCASRSVGGLPHPSPSNFILQPGPTDPARIVGEVERGLYVTELMGYGFNPVTGDFSRGAAGFLIERGELTRPVSEVTVSANFDDLLQRIDAVGNDLDRRSSMMVPTLRVARMTVAGR